MEFKVVAALKLLHSLPLSCQSPAFKKIKIFNLQQSKIDRKK